MANLISRFLFSFAAIAPVPSLDPLDGEFNQLDGANGVLNGGTTAFKLLVKTVDAVDPPIDIDQMSAGPIARWKRNGSTLVQIENSGRIDSSVLTGTPPLSVASTTLVPNLNADLLDNFNINQIHTWWSMNWFVEDPSTFPVNSFSFAQKVAVPNSGNRFVATEMRVICNSGPNAGAFVFVIRKHPFSNQAAQIDIASVNVNPNIEPNTVGVGITSPITPNLVLNDGDWVYPILGAVAGPQQRDVSISLIGYQTVHPF